MAGTLRLLQVEDSPMDVVLLAEALKECSIDVEIRVASDGVAALKLLREPDGANVAWRPDLIVCDLSMPRMDGHTFLSEVKADQATASIPVIILSSSCAPHDISTAYARHANCFIRKPVAFDDLCVIAKRIDEFWNATVVLPTAGNR